MHRVRGVNGAHYVAAPPGVSARRVWWRLPRIDQRTRWFPGCAEYGARTASRPAIGCGGVRVGVAAAHVDGVPAPGGLITQTAAGGLGDCGQPVPPQAVSARSGGGADPQTGLRPLEVFPGRAGRRVIRASGGRLELVFGEGGELPAQDDIAGPLLADECHHSPPGPTEGTASRTVTALSRQGSHVADSAVRGGVPADHSMQARHEGGCHEFAGATVRAP